MKTLIMYYTFGGATRDEAKRLAAENPEAVLCEVKEKRKRNFLGSFIPGCMHAMKRKASKIQPVDADISAFDRIVIGCPIWAGFPAPAWNAMVNLLPVGKEVELFFCSAGGEEPNSEQGNRDAITAKGCTLVSYQDIKTGNPPNKEK